MVPQRVERCRYGDGNHITVTIYPAFTVYSGQPYNRCYSSLRMTLPFPFLDTYVFELNIGLRLLNNHCMDWPEILYLPLLVCYLDSSNSKSSNSIYLKMWFSTCLGLPKFGSEVWFEPWASGPNLWFIWRYLLAKIQGLKVQLPCLRFEVLMA